MDEVVVNGELSTLSGIRRAMLRAIDEQLHEEAAQLLLTINGNVRFTSPDDKRRAMAPVMMERTLKLVQTDPQLRQALLEHARLVEIYNEARKNKFQSHTFVWQ